MIKQRVATAGYAYSEEFEVMVGAHQGYVLSSLLFAIVADVIIENAGGVINEVLNADDLVFMVDSKKRFWN